jgi:DMSO/TMAO reductase YedYZ molybdopterin-dependent catalytic subunit
MTSVKWLTRITAVREPFEGFQQLAYRYRQRPEDEGKPVTRMDPRSLMIPPGIPDFMTRNRIVDAGPHVLRGRAWSGWGPIERVEVSADGGSTWKTAELGDAVSPHAWRSWSFDWDAQPGSAELCCRAADEAGNEQPLEPYWNLGGFSNNAVQRVSVEVRPRG